MAVLARESFDGGFAIDHGRDDLALFAGLLAADHDIVAIADCSIDHGVADDFEHEEIALAHDGFGKGEGFLDYLLGKDWTAGGDAANQGDHLCFVGGWG